LRAKTISTIGRSKRKDTNNPEERMNATIALMSALMKGGR
jgi:hypothetical protein